MNTELVKQEIENILSEVKQPIRKQYPISKKQETELKELGLYDLMPRQYGDIGYTNAAKVLEAAKQGSSAVMDASGEGSEITASKLYQLLNEAQTTDTIILDGDGGSQSLNDSSRSNGFSEGSRIDIWQEADGTFSWCVVGVSSDGNYYEGDDFVGFETLEQARQNALETAELL